MVFESLEEEGEKYVVCQWHPFVPFEAAGLVLPLPRLLLPIHTWKNVEPENSISHGFFFYIHFHLYSAFIMR